MTVEQYIFRFDVAMYDISAVQVIDGREHRSEEVLGLLLAESVFLLR